jgi:hypothetical protein
MDPISSGSVIGATEQEQFEWIGIRLPLWYAWVDADRQRSHG